MRMQNQSNPVWSQFTLERCKQEIFEIAALWKKYLASVDETGLADTTSYKNTKGESFTTKKQEILLYVIMHSAYHRGRIASDMRGAGFTPAYTDFIHAVRQGLMGSKAGGNRQQHKQVPCSQTPIRSRDHACFPIVWLYPFDSTSPASATEAAPVRKVLRLDIESCIPLLLPSLKYRC
jgi:DinB family